MTIADHQWVSVEGRTKRLGVVRDSLDHRVEAHMMLGHQIGRLGTFELSHQDAWLEVGDAAGEGDGSEVKK